MPYVQRDSSGRVSAIFKKPRKNAEELLPDDHPDLQSLFGGSLPQIHQETGTLYLTQTDIGLIRVIEDLIDVLIDKNILMFTDLPVEAREKILFRKSTRERLSGPVGLIESEPDIF